MHKTKYRIIIISIITGLGLVALTTSLLLFSPKPEDNKNHSPVIVTSQDSVKLDSLGGSSPLMTRIAFGHLSKLSFSTSDESVCSVSENGIVTATGDGSATITISADDLEIPEKEIPVEVERTEQNVTAEWNWKGLLNGSSIQLPATSTSGLPLEYHSSDESIAAVDDDGTITAISPGAATISARQPGDPVWQPAEASATIVIADGSHDRRNALEPFFKAMEEQQKWSWDAAFGGGSATIENSKTIGNCTTFPTVSLQRVGLLGEPACVWPHNRHAKAHPEYFELYEPDATSTELINNGELLEGDIVRFDDNGPMGVKHSMVFVGQDEKGRPLWNSAGRIHNMHSNRAVLFSRMSSYDKVHIISILRIKTYPVSVSWNGNGIAGGGGEVMARQDCTVTFAPEPGSRLAKLVIDGIEQQISPDMSSYTFNEVLEPHSIEIAFTENL